MGNINEEQELMERLRKLEELEAKLKEKEDAIAYEDDTYIITVVAE